MIHKKAQIIVLDKDGKAKSTIKVLFNPSEYIMERSVKYSEQSVPGLDIPILRFINGESDTLKMNLFFDTYGTGAIESQNPMLGISQKAPEPLKADVRKYTQQVYGLMAVDGDMHVPPLCKFKWGDMEFTGYVINVSQTFTMFNSLGTPVRATLSVTFKAAKLIDKQLRGEPRNSPDRTKTRVLHQGEHLWELSHREYDDAAKWRVIAEANSVENPRLLKSGSSLKLPAITSD